VLVTRERPGELGAMLAARGATVVHVPLIEVIEPADNGSALRDELSRLDRYGWLIATSPAGAERVGEAARSAPGVRLAAVGTATARVLAAEAGRNVDVVPTVQRAEALAEQLVAEMSVHQRILIAQADIAAPTLADMLRQAGHDVTTVTAYRTIARQPDVEAVDGADAVLFASGSAVESWCRAFGPSGPPLVVAIGPSTAAVADRLGLKVSSVSADHSIDGLVTELERLRGVAAPADRNGPPRRKSPESCKNCSDEASRGREDTK
jgi:uroporphyrinogen-III synthase